MNEIFREGWQWANEQMITFWWRSESWIRIATQVRRALAEVCTVPVLLVYCLLNTLNSITLYGWLRPTLFLLTAER